MPSTQWDSLVAQLGEFVGQPILVSVHAPSAPMVVSLRGCTLSVEVPPIIRSPAVEGVYVSTSSTNGEQFTGFYLRRESLTAWSWSEGLLVIRLGPTQVHVQIDDQD